MSTTPTSKDTIANGDSIGVWPPIYQVVPLSSDYRTSDTATTLNASSDLVTCLKSIAAPGGFGTFYADAINVAQSNLTASARSGARNVIILMSDGEANGYVRQYGGARNDNNGQQRVQSGDHGGAKRGECGHLGVHDLLWHVVVRRLHHRLGILRQRVLRDEPNRQRSGGQGRYLCQRSDEFSTPTTRTAAHRVLTRASPP